MNTVPELRISRTVVAGFVACLLAAVAQPGLADEPKKQSLTPLPSLNTVEECQRADLGRYFGKTFRFHHGECWADVSIDENGKVTSFIRECCLDRPSSRLLWSAKARGQQITLTTTTYCLPSAPHPLSQCGRRAEVPTAEGGATSTAIGV